jgi:regulator of replication initiation timing
MSIEQWSSEIQSFISGLEILKSEHDRLLARNNQLLVENAELEKRIEELE